MAMILVPYNDSMRLGMGFNSYTQSLCIDRAVIYNAHKVKKTANVSQTVTFSSKLVEHLSQIATSLNVSHAVSIKKGTVEVAGNSNAINEEKVKQSDINAVVTVNVVNQTQVIEDDPEFNEMEGLSIQAFNDTYGDSYISGFIEGGNFNGVISMRVLDRSKKDSFVNSLKKSTSSGGKQDFTLDMDSFASAMDNENATNETETTISVSWMGGGQVKDSDVQWDLTSVMQAASKFPDLVADCPQRTWAILTKYKANRSYVQKMLEYQLSPLEYDLVASYTSELFDNYMEYKQLVNNVQQMIQRPNDYNISSKDHAISTEKLSSLIAARAGLRVEMSKIVKAVDVIARDPSVLETDKYLNAEPTDPGVKGFVDSILHPESDEDSADEDDSMLAQLQVGTPREAVPKDTASTATASTSTIPAASGPTTSGPTTTAPTATAPTAVAPADASPKDATKQDGPSQDRTVGDVSSGDKPVKKTGKGKARRHRSDTFGFDFSSMIAPELWAEVLPVLKPADELSALHHGAEPAKASDMPQSLQAFFGPPPANDLADIATHTKPITSDTATTQAPATPKPKSRILLATLGLRDVTDYVRGWVNDDGIIQFHEQQVIALIQQVAPWPDNSFGSNKSPNIVLLFIYKLEGSNTTQMWAWKPLLNSPSNQLVSLSSVSNIHSVSDDTVYPDNAMGVVYSDRILEIAQKPDLFKKVVDQWHTATDPAGTVPMTVGQVTIPMRVNVSGSVTLSVNDFPIGNPYPDQLNAYYVFYRRAAGGQVYCAIGVENLSPAIVRSPYLV